MQAKFPNGHKALNLNGMIQKVYERLDTCVLPSVVPKSLEAKRKSIQSPHKNVSSAKKRKVLRRPPSLSWSKFMIQVPSSSG